MAMNSRKALMDKLKTAKAGGVGVNFRDGKYRLVVKKMALERTPLDKDIFKTVFTVVNATKIPVSSLKTGEVLNVEPNRVGSDVDWIQVKLFEADSPGPGNIRRLIMDLFNKRELSDDDYIETLAEMCDLDENGNTLPEPLELTKGMVIDMETIRVVTKKNKVEIVVPKWSFVEQNEEDRQAMIGWLGQVATHQARVAAQQATA